MKQPFFCALPYIFARLSDHSIIALKAGDPQAFRALVEDYRHKVFNTAISLVQDHGLAEDIAQEVFMIVYRSIATFNEKSAISTWIYRITVNKCTDHLRARQRRKYGLFSQLFNSGDREIADHAAFEHPGVQLEHKETTGHLFAAIDTLPHNQKTAFVLAHLEELPQREIAEIMNMSVKGVESLLQRAKANLRKQLATVYDRRNNKGTSSK